jgi:hypothetical protein
MLLSRCIKEDDIDARTLLATCFGEVGAINTSLLEESKPSCDSTSRKPATPPWHSSPHSFGLQLVTTHLVGALKAAPSSSDQHKIAFAIQQLLAILNEAGKSGVFSRVITGDEAQRDEPSRISWISSSSLGSINKPKMDETLIRILIEARVIDVVEPFWFSEFHEVSYNSIFRQSFNLLCYSKIFFPNRLNRMLQSRFLFFVIHRPTTAGFQIGADSWFIVLTRLEKRNGQAFFTPVAQP